MGVSTGEGGTGNCAIALHHERRGRQFIYLMGGPAIHSLRDQRKCETMAGHTARFSNTNFQNFLSEKHSLNCGN